MLRLIHGDCLEEMKKMPPETYHAAVTDPPYALGKPPDMPKLLAAWLNGDGYDSGAGFMSKKWDKVCGPEYWREVYRVLKPGAHLLAFCATRTWDLLSLSIRLAGFEMRDTIASFGGVPALAHLQGQGFPKGHSVPKALDKPEFARRESMVKDALVELGFEEVHWQQSGDLKEVFLIEVDGIAMDVERLTNGKFHKPEYLVWTEPVMPIAKKFAGFNVALKPSFEVILVFRKPFRGTVAENVLATNCGALNIDATRVPVIGKSTKRIGAKVPTGEKGIYGRFEPPSQLAGHQKGRWPSNTLLTHSAGCVRRGMRKVKGNIATRGASTRIYGGGKGFTNATDEPIGYADPDGLETIQNYECDESCPISVLDEMAGERKCGGIGKVKADGFVPAIERQSPGGRVVGNFHNDTGTASRFFPQFEQDCEPECPSRLLNEQTKEMRCHKPNTGQDYQASCRDWDLFWANQERPLLQRQNDEGQVEGPSRFYPEFTPDEQDCAPNFAEQWVVAPPPTHCPHCGEAVALESTLPHKPGGTRETIPVGTIVPFIAYEFKCYSCGERSEVENEPAEKCTCEILAEQSGERPGGGQKKDDTREVEGRSFALHFGKESKISRGGEEGTATRYFQDFQPDECCCEILAGQSGESGPSYRASNRAAYLNTPNPWGPSREKEDDRSQAGHLDSGTAIRYYSQFTPDPADEPCVCEVLAGQSGESKSRGGFPKDIESKTLPGWKANIGPSTGGLGDEGAADRFFPNFTPDPADCTRFRYCPKAPRSQRYFYCHDCDEVFPVKERKEHGHGHEDNEGKQTWEHVVYMPTQKPLDIMKWLLRLVVAPGGTVLDPFCGSGTTLVAAHHEGFDAVGIERDDYYYRIAEKRIEIECSQPKQLELAKCQT